MIQNYKLLLEEVSNSLQGSGGGNVMRTAAQKAADTQKERRAQTDAKRHLDAQKDANRQFQEMRDRRKARAKRSA